MKYVIFTCIGIWKKIGKHRFYRNILSLKPWQIFKVITKYILQVSFHALVIININVVCLSKTNTKDDKMKYTAGWILFLFITFYDIHGISTGLFYALYAMAVICCV